MWEYKEGRRRRRNLFRIVHARGAIPNEMGGAADEGEVSSDSRQICSHAKEKNQSREPLSLTAT